VAAKGWISVQIKSMLNKTPKKFKPGAREGWVMGSVE